MMKMRMIMMAMVCMINHNYLSFKLVFPINKRKNLIT